MSPIARLGFPILLVLATIEALPSAYGDDFETSVAPILESRCVRCHNNQTRKGGLSMSTSAALRAGGDAGPAIEPGKPDESLLVDMITGSKPQMPKQGQALSAGEVDAIRTWIEQGASWPDGLALVAKKAVVEPWWAIQPLRQPSIPSARNTDWIRTPIDAFILAQLESNGLTPTPEADCRTLIRRVTFDLTGLPPTPAEVREFVDDARPDAYEHLVDRLLASPRYGERWARHWLDVVHYGDTHGYDKDKRRDHAWRYRDYVIKSLNADIPYDRFVREQLAGDALWPDDPSATIATGFIAAGPWDFVGHVELADGTVEKMKTRLIDRDDMVANTMSTFVSLTVHCARCHDHKFDPIPSRDYYALQAVFAGVDRGNLPIEPIEIKQRRAVLAAEETATVEALAQIEAAVMALDDPRLAELQAKHAAALADPPGGPSLTNGYHSTIHPKPDALAWVAVDLIRSVPIDEIRLIPARPTDFPDTPGFGFPKVFKVELSDDQDFRNARVVHEESRGDDAAQPDEPLRINVQQAKARHVRVSATRLWKRSNDYVFALAELQVISGGVNVARDAAVSALDSIEAGRWSKRFLVDDYSSRSRLTPPNEGGEPLGPLKRIEAQRAERIEQLLDTTTRMRRRLLSERLATLRADQAALPPPEQVYAVLSHEPRPIHVLHRGEVEQPGEASTPGSLGCVPGLAHDFSSLAGEPEPARRAALAAWIVDRENMLTWRSIVNRVWHHHFGRGLVETPNDFGRNGSSPTHPELLDWLAAEFRDGDRSLKRLHRLIVTSAVYKQSSSHNPAAALVDAENRLLWRQNRRRLEAEELRDAVLTTSGALDARMFGPGFEVFRFKDDHSPTYDHEDARAIVNPDGHRRAVYRFIVRSVPNPWIDCMDGADPNANVPVRNTTITALQALALLNDPFMLDQSRAFAARVEHAATGLEQRIHLAFQLASGREPSQVEQEALAHFAAGQGLAATCRVLFNRNEFIFVD